MNEPTPTDTPAPKTPFIMTPNIREEITAIVPGETAGELLIDRLMQKDVTEAIAEVLANCRATRRGGLPIQNVLDILPPHLRDEVMSDALLVQSRLFMP